MYGSSELNRGLNQYGMVTLSSSMKKVSPNKQNESLDSSICTDLELFKPLLKKSLGYLDKNIIVSFKSICVSIYTQQAKHPFQQLFLSIPDMKDLVKLSLADFELKVLECLQFNQETRKFDFSKPLEGQLSK